MGLANAFHLGFILLPFFGSLPKVFSGGLFGAQQTLQIPNGTCTDLFIPVNISTNAALINLTMPQNQTQVVGFVQELFSTTSNISELIVGTHPLETTYELFSRFCVPNMFEDGGVLEVAIHGLTLDHFYWEIGGPGSGFNFIDSALAAGHAVLTFDRLGVGKSSTPDGIQEVQGGVEVKVTEALISRLRQGLMGHTFGPIIGVGHSFGSVQLTALTASFGNIVDGLILTGFNNIVLGLDTFMAGLGLGIASEINSTLFGNLSNAYLTESSVINVQQLLFHFPNFPQSTLDFTANHVATISIGELVDFKTLFRPVTKFSGPILVVAGAKDIPACAGNCFQSVNGSSDLLEPTKESFPAVTDFTTMIQADAGHNHLAHFGADEILKNMQDWVDERFSLET